MSAHAPNDYEYEIMQIVWQQDMMRFGLRDKEQQDEESWAYTAKNDFEIIGNIYETPELIKQT